jgi:hypothetical protein
MEKRGFDAVQVEREHLRFQQDLREGSKRYSGATCFQLLAIPRAAYEAGLRRLSGELGAQDGRVLREKHLLPGDGSGEKTPRTG